MFININCERLYLWWASITKAQCWKVSLTKTRDKTAALKVLKTAMRKHGQPEVIVTDRLGFYGAAMKKIGKTYRPLAVHARGELALSLSTTRTGDASRRADTTLAESRRHPRIQLQPLQSGPLPLKPIHFQAQPRRRYGQIGQSWRGIRDSTTVQSETRSNSSGSTLFPKDLFSVPDWMSLCLCYGPQGVSLWVQPL
jgi:hypothetical protein